MIHTTATGPLNTDTSVELEHNVDTTPGDPYEAITVYIDGKVADLTIEDAEKLGAKLLMFAGQVKAAEL